MARVDRSIVACAVCLAFALALAVPSAQAVEPAAGGEPAFTNTTTNTWFFTWNNSGASPDYSVCFILYKDGAAQNGKLDDCHKLTGSSGTISRQYSGLQEGHVYTVSPFTWQLVGGFMVSMGIDRTSTTTIDLTGPAINVSIDGPAEFTNDPVLALHIGYNDALSYPFPGPAGGATVACLTLGAPCGAAQAAYQEDCSHAQAGRNRVNAFDCTMQWSGADGKLFYCADEADAAMPDNPADVNQSATSDKGNHSGFVCGSTTLDRVAPVVSATANGGASVAVLRGDAVKLRATARDAGAGPDEQYEWDFGDHTRRGSGAATTHTFTRLGTFVVRATTHDKAKTVHSATPPYYVGGPGNAGTGTVKVRVVRTADAVTQNASAGALAIQAPRSFRLRPNAKVPVALSTTAPGRAGLSLVCRRRTVARGGRRFAKPGAARLNLRLRNTAKPGACSLKVSFKADGAAKTTVKRLRIALRAR